MKKYNQIDISVKNVTYVFIDRTQSSWEFTSGRTKQMPKNLYEIAYMKEGSYITAKNNIKYRIKEGDLTLLRKNPDTPFYNYSESLPCFYYAIIFESDSDFFYDFFNNERITVIPKYPEEIENLFIKATDIFIKKTLTWQMDIRAITTTLLSNLINTYYNTKNIVPVPDLFNTVISYIHEHIYIENINIKDLAEMVNISIEHFIRSFKIYFGMSPKKYINKIKLNHAVELLRNSGKSISDIATSSGFNDSAYFSRIFKEEYKVSPSQFKKNL